MGSGLISYHQVLAVQQRAQIARSVVAVSDVASFPGPGILKDFDAICAMDGAQADVQLLQLLK